MFSIVQLPRSAASIQTLRWSPWWGWINLDHPGNGQIYRKPPYLVVKTMVSCRFSLKPIQWWFQSTPLKNIWVRQLGWWNSQYMEIHKKKCSKPPTSYDIWGMVIPLFLGILLLAIVIQLCFCGTSISHCKCRIQALTIPYSTLPRMDCHNPQCIRLYSLRTNRQPTRGFK